MNQNTQSNSAEQRFNGWLRPAQLEGSRAGTLGDRDFIVAMRSNLRRWGENLVLRPLTLTEPI
jgi:type IV secretion system protein VirB10